MTPAEAGREAMEESIQPGAEPAAQALKRALALPPPGPEIEDPVALTLSRTGAELEERGLYADAAAVYRILAEAPDACPLHRVSAWFRLGAVLEHGSQPEQALQAWLRASEEPGSADISRNAAFYAACLMERLGQLQQADRLLDRLQQMGGSGNPSPAAVAFKRAAVQLALGEEADVPLVRQPLDWLATLTAMEAAAALNRSGLLETSRRLYIAILDSPHLDEPSRKAVLRTLGETEDRLSLRSGALLSHKPAVDAVLAEIDVLLARGDIASVQAAGRLCNLLPEKGHDTEVEARARARTAYELEQQGLVEEAAPLYRAVAGDAAAPGAERSHSALRLGLILLSTGHRSEALDLFRKSLELPGVPLVRNVTRTRLFDCLVHESGWEEALSLADAALEEAAEAEDEGRELFWNLQRTRCRAELRLLEDSDPDSCEFLPDAGADVDDATATLWMEAGFALEQCGYMLQSRVFYERLLTAPELPQPVKTNLHFRLGLVLDRMLAFSEAEAHLVAAIEAPACFPAAQAEARLRLASLRFLMEEYEAALPDLDMVRSDPSLAPRVRAEAQLRYGTSLYRLERFDEARSELMRCRERGLGGESPIEVKAELLLAELCEAVGEFDQACGCYNHVIAHPHSEPSVKAAALTRLQQLRKGGRR